jgi:RNA exonuclease 1
MTTSNFVCNHIMPKNKSRLKRSAEQFEADDLAAHDNGVASTLARLQNQSGEEGWTTVGPKGAKRQKVKAHENKAGPSSNKPGLKIADSHRLTHMLKIQELQGLLLYCLADGPAPQWVSVRQAGQVQKAIVLMVPGLERAMFTGEIPLPDDMGSEITVGVGASSVVGVDGAMPGEEAKKSSRTNVSYVAESGPDEYLPIVLDKTQLCKALAPIADVFEQLLPVKAPGDDKFARLFSPLHAMLTSSIPKSQEEKKLDKQTKGAKPTLGRDWVNQRTAITEFITAREDLSENDYVLHPAFFATVEEKEAYAAKRVHGKSSAGDGWVDTLVKSLDDGNVPAAEFDHGSVTAGHTILALDCEMCLVGEDEFALARISIVGWDGEVLLDEYVKPDKPIVNYLTQYSGITPELLKDVSTSLSDIQKRLLEMLHPRAIIIGHSLESDLRALKMTHPFIVDTSILYPHPRGPPLKSSLKWLSQKYLSQEIQQGHGTRGHNSIEDARATLELVKQKCEKGSRWGSSEANTESIFKRLAKTNTRASVAPRPKTSAVVDHGSGERSFGAMADYYIACKDDAEIVAGVKRALLGDPDGAYIPGGGVDLTFARLRDLEALRGWWNDNRDTSKDVDANNANKEQSSPSHTELTKAVTTTIQQIADIRSFLPPCTLMILYTGTGDPREMARLQQMHRTFKKEYATKKWDELSVRWTDVEEQALRAAVTAARKGLGFVCMS